MKNFKWAILGAGNIAEKFAEGLKSCDRAELYAVASRSLEKSMAFAKKFGFSKAYGSYSEMLADKEVDVVYIATPNHLHYEHAMETMRAGKAALCEKPIAFNRNVLQEMIDFSRSSNCFLMEALWSRFLPSIQKFKEMAFSGEYGDALFLRADFGFRAKYDSKSRLFDPAIGGGAVYDIGIYPLFLALYLFGEVSSVEAEAMLAPTGTDAVTSILLKHKSGKMSSLNCSFSFNMNSQAQLYCSDGTLVLPHFFHMPQDVTILRYDAPQSIVKAAGMGNGYNYEADEVMDCLENGLIESRVMPHDFSLQLSDLIDNVYKKIGAVRWR